MEVLSWDPGECWNKMSSQKKKKKIKRLRNSWEVTKETNTLVIS